MYRSASTFIIGSSVVSASSSHILIEVSVCPAFEYTKAAKRSVISIEKTAQNLDDCEIADNAGVFRHQQTIDKSASEFLHTNLPIEKYASVLSDEGFPVEISHSAGNFICNHLYFHALNMPERPRDVLFVHIPPTEDMNVINHEYSATLPFKLIEAFFTSLIQKIAT